MSKKYFSVFAVTLAMHAQAFAYEEHIKGQISDWNNEPIPFAIVTVKESNQTAHADENGRFEFENLPAGSYTLIIKNEGYKEIEYPVNIKNSGTRYYNITLQEKKHHLKSVDVVAKKQYAEKLDVLTRLPLKPNEQIQSITVISDKVITQQGALTLSEASKNAAGVYTFATYGNTKESMSMRGFRGVPILKNGVRINSDFRGQGVLTDMQGLESVQVLKGASAVSQGIATDIGSPGGVINMVTKTPHFTNNAIATLRIGSWGQVRPAFDVQSVLDKAQTVAFRLNGAYERANSYRPGISSERIYINPSLEWRPNNKTTITAEMDYLYDSRTPDPGTINMARNDSNAIYQIPYDRFPGFSDNRAINKGTTYALRLKHRLNNSLAVRVAYFASRLDIDAIITSFSTGSTASGNLPLLENNKRYRTIGSSERKDNNSVLQLDLVGRKLRTGALKHTFMLGADYRQNNLSTATATMDKLSYVDIIDFYKKMSNALPANGFKYTPAIKNADGNITTPEKTSAAAIKLSPTAPVTSSQSSFGVLAQDVISYEDYVKLILGFRYSSQVSKSSASATSYVTGTAFDPQLGLIVSPAKNINLFVSYTSSTSLSGATNLDTLGNKLGNQKINQIEAGIKTNWLNDRLFFNITLYKINNRNMSLPVYDANWNATGFFTKGGNDERKGIEVDIMGKLFSNLEVMAGYAYIDAQYKEHTSYISGSSPLNTPKHTANFWANYTVERGALRGLGLGLSAYYIGKRPVNDWAMAVTHDGIVPGQKPFDIKAYTTVNAQLSYQYRQIGLRFLANNIFNQIGYNAYRTSYINQTDPRNFALIASYKF